MNILNKKINIGYCIALILSLFSLIFKGYLSNIIFLVLGIVAWSYIFFCIKKESTTELALIKLAIYSIPLSYTNIFNGSYGKLPVSWFNIFILLITIKAFVNVCSSKRLRLNMLSKGAIIVLLVSTVPLLKSLSFVDGLKQYINMSIPFLFVIIGSIYINILTNEQKSELNEDYIKSVTITAIGVLVQVFCINFIDLEVGLYGYYGGDRKAYAFLFSDYSLISLYLASGAMMVYFYKQNSTEKIKWIPNILLLIGVSILTSARTGIVSFMVVLVLYSFIKLFKSIRKKTIKSSYGTIVFNIVVVFLGYRLIKWVRPEDTTQDSGRVNLNNEAADIFTSEPLTGVGLGVSSYGQKIGTIPHNIVFQSLAQGGLIYTIPLIVFLLLILYYAFRRNREVFWVTTTVLIGSLFIPDILNSRFLGILFFLISIKNESNINI